MIGDRSLERAVTTLLLLVMTAGCFTQSNIPSGVTGENIRRVELAMTRAEVEGILGPPVEVERREAKDYGPDAETLIYFHRLPIPRHYPMLWVHLANGRVVEVYAKRHNTAESDGMYGLSADRQWEAADFMSTFP
jgi:hypothetical protein